MKTTILLDYSFSADAKFSEKSKFLACSYQGVRNVSFSENFAYVLNEWPLCKASNNIMKSTCITTENAAKASFITSKNKRTNCVLWRPFLISHVTLISKWTSGLMFPLDIFNTWLNYLWLIKLQLRYYKFADQNANLHFSWICLVLKIFLWKTKQVKIYVIKSSNKVFETAEKLCRKKTIPFF